MDRVIELATLNQPEAIAIALFEKTLSLPSAYAALDKSVGGVIAAALERSDLSLGKGELTTLHTPPGTDKKAPKRVYLLGLGSREKLDHDVLRTGAARLVRALGSAKINSLQLHLLDGIGEIQAPNSSADFARAIGDGLALASFDFSEFKGTGSSKETSTASAKTAATKTPALKIQAEASLKAGIAQALEVGKSVNLIRHLQATPPNVASTKYMVDFGKKISRETGLKCNIIDEKQATKLGMGGLLAVGAGGSFPPALISLEHKPRNAKGAPILLVGKAITFDTGGYSVKPAADMDRMKYDKSGGCVVMGTMHAIAKLKLPVHVIGLMTTAENMISNKAYRPGDILKMYNGVTVEVTNTDAEGRLVLGDALSYGIETHQPQAVIDLATLTGAVIVALGTQCAGMFCDDASLREQLTLAGQRTRERLWHLPMWEDYKPLLKGTHGDIVNAGIREAGATQGAMFLSYFTGPQGKPISSYPSQGPAWAHLDIAGTAETKKDSPLYSSGPTGFGVRLLVNLLENWK